MFIGHFGIGLGAKKIEPKISIGTYFIAVQFLDLLWPTLLLLNIEHVAIKPGTSNSQPLDFIDYPFSHSLVMVIIWAVIFGTVHWIFKKNFKAAIILAICVISHWVLDLIVHLPDLPLYPGKSPLFGFGLWNLKYVTLAVEAIMFIVGADFYLSVTKAKNTSGKIVIWVLILLLGLTHLANIFGPPPTNVNAIAWGAQLQWVFVLLAYWADRNRLPVS